MTPCYYAQILFLRVLQGNTFLDLHKLILSRQGCFIIQQCLLTITSYLFTNKLSEYCVANLNIFYLLWFSFLCKTSFIQFGAVRCRLTVSFKVERLIRSLTERGRWKGEREEARRFSAFFLFPSSPAREAIFRLLLFSLGYQAGAPLRRREEVS